MERLVRLEESCSWQIDRENNDTSLEHLCREDKEGQTRLVHCCETQARSESCREGIEEKVRSHQARPSRRTWEVWEQTGVVKVAQRTL